MVYQPCNNRCMTALIQNETCSQVIYFFISMSMKCVYNLFMVSLSVSSYFFNRILKKAYCETPKTETQTMFWIHFLNFLSCMSASAAWAAALAGKQGSY